MNLSKEEEIKKAKIKFEENKKNIKDRNQKNKFNQNFKNITSIAKLSKEQGLYLDQNYLDSLSLILGYGYESQLEIQQKIEDIMFSAILKRECFREAEDLVIRKYSRKTEKQIVVFGLITQSLEDIHVLPEHIDKPETMKEALMYMIEVITNFEQSFTGRLKNEVVIDPIAAYVEL